jgi:hypothetical protein
MIYEFEHNLFVYLYFSLWMKLETDKPLNKLMLKLWCVYVCMELTSLSVDNVNELHFFLSWLRKTFKHYKHSTFNKYHSTLASSTLVVWFSKCWKFEKKKFQIFFWWLKIKDVMEYLKFCHLSRWNLQITLIIQHMC